MFIILITKAIDRILKFAVSLQFPSELRLDLANDPGTACYLYAYEHVYGTTLFESVHVINSCSLLRGGTKVEEKHRHLLYVTVWSEAHGRNASCSSKH
jgi:hypothetical protein